MNILFLILLLLILMIVGSTLDSITRVKTKVIELPILWLDEYSAQLEELGVEQSATDFNSVKYITFYKIDSLTPIEIEGRDCTVLMSSGQEYTTTLKIEEVKQLIENE